MIELSWKKRLAIILSFIWLALTGAISHSETDSLTVFLIFGALPIAFLWGSAWVWSGFRQQRTIAEVTSADLQVDESVPTVSLYLWVAVILLTTGFGVFYYAFAETDVDPASKIGYLIGFYFWIPILVYVLWKSAFKRRKGVGTLLFAVAFLGIAIYQSQAMLREKEETQRFLSNVQTMFLKIMNGELIDKAELSGTGQFRPLLIIIYDFWSQALSDFEALSSAIETSGLETMLSPDTFEDPRAINEAIAKLNSLGVIINETDIRLNSRYKEYPRAIDSADIRDNLKASLKKGAEVGIDQGKAVLSEFFTIQRAFIATTTELLEFMKQKQGRFTRQGDQILFADQADAATYNEYVQLIQALALEESEWHNRQLSSSVKQIEKMTQVQ